MHFEMLYIINIYRYLQIPQVFPRDPAMKVQKQSSPPQSRA